LSDVEESWDVIVLGSGVGLDDVSTLSLDVEVVDTGGVGNSSGAGNDVEHVSSVLEGTSELGGIDGELDGVSILADHGVFLNRRVWLVLGVVSESSLRVVELLIVEL